MNRLEWQIEKCFKLETELEKEKQRREEAEKVLLLYADYENELFGDYRPPNKAREYFKKYGELNDK